VIGRGELRGRERTFADRRRAGLGAPVEQDVLPQGLALGVGLERARPRAEERDDRALGEGAAPEPRLEHVAEGLVDRLPSGELRIGERLPLARGGAHVPHGARRRVGGVGIDGDERRRQRRSQRRRDGGDARPPTCPRARAQRPRLRTDVRGQPEGQSHATSNACDASLVAAPRGSARRRARWRALALEAPIFPARIVSRRPGLGEEGRDALGEASRPPRRVVDPRDALEPRRRHPLEPGEEGRGVGRERLALDLDDLRVPLGAGRRPRAGPGLVGGALHRGLGHGPGLPGVLPAPAAARRGRLLPKLVHLHPDLGLEHRDLSGRAVEAAAEPGRQRVGHRAPRALADAEQLRKRGHQIVALARGEGAPVTLEHVEDVGEHLVDVGEAHERRADLREGRRIHAGPVEPADGPQDAQLLGNEGCAEARVEAPGGGGGRGAAHGRSVRRAGTARPWQPQPPHVAGPVRGTLSPWQPFGRSPRRRPSRPAARRRASDSTDLIASTAAVRRGPPTPARPRQDLDSQVALFVVEPPVPFAVETGVPVETLTADGRRFAGAVGRQRRGAQPGGHRDDRGGQPAQMIVRPRSAEGGPHRGEKPQARGVQALALAYRGLVMPRAVPHARRAARRTRPAGAVGARNASGRRGTAAAHIASTRGFPGAATAPAPRPPSLPTSKSPSPRPTPSSPRPGSPMRPAGHGILLVSAAVVATSLETF
jgi:hypothetical protein